MARDTCCAAQGSQPLSLRSALGSTRRSAQLIYDQGLPEVCDCIRPSCAVLQTIPCRPKVNWTPGVHARVLLSKASASLVPILGHNKPIPAGFHATGNMPCSPHQFIGMEGMTWQSPPMLQEAVCLDPTPLPLLASTSPHGKRPSFTGRCTRTREERDEGGNVGHGKLSEFYGMRLCKYHHYDFDAAIRQHRYFATPTPSRCRRVACQ